MTRRGRWVAAWAALASVLLVAACGGHSANGQDVAGASGAAASEGLGGEGGGLTLPVNPPASGSGGLSLIDPLPGSGGTGGASSPLSDGCDCTGDGFGARVRFDEEEDEELLEFNRPDEARCPGSAPAHAVLTNGCAGDRLSLWLGYGADGAAPQLTVLGSALTYVDRDGVIWTGTLTYYPAPKADAHSVIVGELELIVWNEAGEVRTLHVSYQLCAGYLPRALVIC